MKTVYAGGEGEIVEKKSRFIATVRPVSSEEEAVAFINEMKKKYWDARHNCSAFVIGDRQEISRCSDDGEPAQTAGRPILDVLLKEEIHNVCVVVTRYFGGTLLGTGGLVRAYQKATQTGLENSVIIDKQIGRKTDDRNGLQWTWEITVSDRKRGTDNDRYRLYRESGTDPHGSKGKRAVF